MNITEKINKYLNEKLKFETGEIDVDEILSALFDAGEYPRLMKPSGPDMKNVIGFPNLGPTNKIWLVSDNTTNKNYALGSGSRIDKPLKAINHLIPTKIQRG